MPNFFNKIVIDATASLGATYTAYDSDLIFGSLQEASAMALIGDNLSIDELTFTLRGTSSRYSGVDFTSCAGCRDLAYVYHGATLMAKYYIQSVLRVGRNGGFAFTCVSAIGLLDQREHVGGVYNGTTAGTIISDIMGNIPYTIDATLANTALYGWLPYAQRSATQLTARDNLEQVLFACGASVMRDANQDLEFTYNLPGTMSVFNLAGEVYAGSSRDAIAPATLVRLTEHTFFASAGVASEVLYEDSSPTVLNHYKIVFDRPYHSLTWTGATIDESGANYAVLSGSGVLTGIPYVHIQRVRNKSTGAAGETKEIAVTNATLISNLNADSALDRLAAFYAQSEEISAEVLAGTERPGSAIQIPDPNDWTQTVHGYVKSMDRSYSTTVKAAVKLTQGWAPGNVGNSYDSFLIVRKSNITSGKWTVPSALRGKRALIVMFGGGQGGQGGWYGTDPSHANGSNTIGASFRDRSNITHNFRKLGSIQQGGAGGHGGHGGFVGKMLQFNIASLASSYSVALGTGGTGGAGGTETRGNQLDAIYVDPTDGAYGSHSTFAGTYDTDDGVYPQAAIINIIDGSVLVPQRGDDGVAGAAGGAGGPSNYWAQNTSTQYDYTTAGKGGNGASLGSYSGGAGANGAVGRYAAYGSSGAYRHFPLGGGGGGGGAANGGNGSAGKVQSNFRYTQSDDGFYWSLGRLYEWTEEDGTHYTSYSADGGDGGNASIIPAKSDLKGGQGGAGGGGGGGCGQLMGNETYYNQTNVIGSGYGGKGGNGASGGAGSDGWFIVYYKA